MSFEENHTPLLLPVIPSRDVVTSVYVPRGGTCASRAFPIHRGLHYSSSAAAARDLDCRRRHIKGRGLYGRQGRCPPPGWSPGIVHSGGRIIGNGIGSFLSKGLTHVAKKGGQIIKKVAKKHGTKVACQIKRRGTRLVKKQLESTKRHVKRSLRRGVKDTRKSITRGVKRSITSTLDNLGSKLKSTESSLRNKRRKTGSSLSSRKRKRTEHALQAAALALPVKRRRRGGGRRRRGRRLRSRKSFIGLSDRAYTGLI